MGGHRGLLLEDMKKHTKVDVKRINVKAAVCGSWVNLQHGRTLCRHLGLERQLQPLLEYAQRLQGDDVATDRPQDQDQGQDHLAETGVHPLFVAVRALPKPESQVMKRTAGRPDFRNLTESPWHNFGPT
ncbi:hypothetical protein MMC28_007018 [Mycoblastus sanguinarius]|nr:hypothetical protein [Mycoblastus sanguinarius]